MKQPRTPRAPRILNPDAFTWRLGVLGGLIHSVKNSEKSRAGNRVDPPPCEFGSVCENQWIIGSNRNWHKFSTTDLFDPPLSSSA
jgi:hypothetical protein